MGGPTVGPSASRRARAWSARHHSIARARYLGRPSSMTGRWSGTYLRDRSQELLPRRLVQQRRVRSANLSQDSLDQVILALVLWAGPSSCLSVAWVCPTPGFTRETRPERSRSLFVPFGEGLSTNFSVIRLDPARHGISDLAQRRGLSSNSTVTARVPWEPSPSSEYERTDHGFTDFLTSEGGRGRGRAAVRLSEAQALIGMSPGKASGSEAWGRRRRG
jgi:hypothetical protein